MKLKFYKLARGENSTNFECTYFNLSVIIKGVNSIDKIEKLKT